MTRAPDATKVERIGQKIVSSHLIMTDKTEGASYSEQLLECARRNNVELFGTIKSEITDVAELASLINSTKEPITGNTPLHLATLLGNWEFIDMVLDVEGVEIDPINREGDTPLHMAVKFAGDEPDYGYFIIDNLVDAGLDPSIADRHGLKPVQYVKDNEKLRELLESAEYAAQTGEVDGEEVDDVEEGTPSDLE